MDTQSPSPLDADAEAALRAADAAYYREVLHEMIETGRGLVRSIRRTSEAVAMNRTLAPDELAEVQAVIAAAFDKECRTVRRCIRLAEWLSDPARKRAEVAKAAPSFERAGVLVQSARERGSRSGDDERLMQVCALDALDAVEVEQFVVRPPPVEIALADGAEGDVAPVPVAAGCTPPMQEWGSSGSPHPGPLPQAGERDQQHASSDRRGRDPP